MNRALLPLFLLASMATAQTTATVPNPVSPQNIDRPFPGGIGRYQQWYSAFSLQAAIPEPMRFEQLEFFAGTTQSSNATTIDMEVLISHGQPFGVTGLFDSNYASTPILVVPRQNVQLLAGSSGQVVMTLPFSTRFTWDRVRPVLVEIRIYGNSRSNQPFPYNLRGSTASVGTTTRVYQAGSPGATSGLVQQGVGLATRFSARPGVAVEYGNACPGEGNFLPTHQNLQLAWPGITWNHQIANVASQRVCIWAIGDSDAMFGPTQLPADFGTLLGMAPFGCYLRNNVVASNLTVSVGGGAGAGIANTSMMLPAVTWYIGLSLYTQWAVLDPFSPNGMLSASTGVRYIVAPVGG
ncbi:MAG: hypothetical protein KDC48_05110 [Planctomycetes bacterium]|nr:hypothetical protein [Planctomycetota bacterium]